MKTIQFLCKQLLLLWLSCLVACVGKDRFSVPDIDCEDPGLVPTNTLQQLKDFYSYGGPKIIDTELVVVGYVASSDAWGNSYKTLSLQDHPSHPTAGIKMAIDQANYHTKYSLGSKLYIRLKGLAIGYVYGNLQVGKALGNTLGRIPRMELNDHLIRSCEIASLKPKEVSIQELDKSLSDILLALDQVQFSPADLGKSYGNLDNNDPADRLLQQVDSTCKLAYECVLRTSGYADFKDHLLPEGKGRVVGLLAHDYSDSYLTIGSPEEVLFTEDPCGATTLLSPTTTIAAIRERYTGNLFEFGLSDAVVEGYVISSDQEGNFQQTLVVQDAAQNPVAGIRILVSATQIFKQFIPGDKVYIRLSKLYMDRVDGLLTLGYPAGTSLGGIEESAIGYHLYNSGTHQELIPTDIGIEQAGDPSLESTLVRVQEVQLVSQELGSAFTYFSGTQDQVRLVETCGVWGKLGVFTRGEASFANALFPEGKGFITGVLGHQLEIRNPNDVQFNDPYDPCPVLLPKVMITEVADPKNQANARFVELYNAGNTAMDLSGWTVQKYTNGSSAASGEGLSLSNLLIPSSGFIILANTGYAGVFNDNPDLESSYISGNGDDVYALVDATGTVQDVYGRMGEDGNGKDWEYLDGRAYRNANITEPTPSFEPSEWTVYAGVSNPLIGHPNSPQYAPQDCTPRIR